MYWLVVAGMLSSQPTLQAGQSALFPKEQDGRYGYVDEAGKFVIQPQFVEAQEFSEGLAAVRVSHDSSWGYIDRAGHFVIPPAAGFFSATPFSEGLAAVSIGAYRSEFDYHDGRAILSKRPVMESEKWGYIDPTGHFVVTPRFNWADRFSEGRAVVAVNDRYGYVDPAGRYAHRPEFLSAGRFSDGRAVVEIPGATGSIDRSGLAQFPPHWSRTRLGKLARGLANSLTGWLEVPIGFAECCQAPELKGHWVGVVVPACMYLAGWRGISRELGGVVETVTFPIAWPRRYYTNPLFDWGQLSDFPWVRR